MGRLSKNSYCVQKDVVVHSSAFCTVLTTWDDICPVKAETNLTSTISLMRANSLHNVFAMWYIQYKPVLVSIDEPTQVNIQCAIILLVKSESQTYSKTEQKQHIRHTVDHKRLHCASCLWFSNQVSLNNKWRHQVLALWESASYDGVSLAAWMMHAHIRDQGVESER